MQNYLSKQNFGIPAGLACITAYLLGYGVTRSLSLLWVAIVFTAFVFMFNFDEKVREAVKRGMTLSVAYHVIAMGLYILNSIVAWFGVSSFNVVNKIITIIGDLAQFVILIAFIALIVSTILNKDKNMKISD